MGGTRGEGGEGKWEGRGREGRGVVYSSGRKERRIIVASLDVSGHDGRKKQGEIAC